MVAFSPLGLANAIAVLSAPLVRTYTRPEDMLAAAGTPVSDTSTPLDLPPRIANPEGAEGVVSICTPAYPICMESEVDFAAYVSAVSPDPAVVVQDAPPLCDMLKVVVSRFLGRRRTGFFTLTVTPGDVIRLPPVLRATAVRI